MSGSNDLLAQTLLQQSRQPRRPSAQALLAQQMMHQSQQGGPVWGVGPTIARAVPGVVAALLARDAEANDQNRENEDFKRNAQYAAQRDERQQQEFQQFAGMLGLGGGAPAPSAQPPVETGPAVPYAARQPAPVPTEDAGAMAASGARYASVPGRAPLGASYGNMPENRGPTIPNPDFNASAPESATNPRTIENPWHDLRGQLPPANGRMANLNPQTPIAGRLAADAGRTPDPQAAALLAAASSNPRIAAMAPLLAQTANRQGRFVEMVGPQGAGTYEVPPNGGAPRFVGGRLPPQEGAETFSSAPQTVMQNGQPVMVQIGNRGTVRPMTGYQPRNEGPFQGSSVNGQALNILLDPRADPSSPTYAAAYQEAYGPRTITQADGTIVTIQPAAPSGVRAPGAQAPAPSSAAPAVSAPTTSPGVSASAAAPEVSQTPAATVTRVPSTSGPLTEAQSRANMFGNAMTEGHRILEGTSIPGNATLLAWRNAPESIVNMGLDENDQRYFNALRQFAAGVLRKETGAAFSAGELLDVQSRFFPMPGDTLIVRQQKARARQQAIASMQAELPGGQFRGQLPPSGAAPAGEAPSRVLNFDARGQRVQ